jgi:hypothetical protein
LLLKIVLKACHIKFADAMSYERNDSGSEFIQKVQPSKVLPNGVELNPITIYSTGFYSTALGRTLLSSTFFMNSDPDFLRDATFKTLTFTS